MFRASAWRPVLPTITARSSSNPHHLSPSRLSGLSFPSRILTHISNTKHSYTQDANPKDSADLDTSKMPLMIHFIRHAQGYHNLSYANQSIHDPMLTPFGEQQCKLLAKTFPYAAVVDGIVASPLRRTIYTALLSFPDTRLSIVTLPELQETSDQPCDTGSSKAELEKEFLGKNVNFDNVVDGWNSKTGKWSPEKTMVEARAKAARQWLMSRPEKHLVVVTHGGLLHHLTEDWIGSDHVAGTGWANTEYRSYTFDPARTATASLVETEDSRTRRRGTEKPLSEAEQRNLKQSAEKEWEKHGYVKADNQPRAKV